MSKLFIRLMLSCLLAFFFVNEEAIAQSAGGKIWNSPDGQARFVRPAEFRKNRLKDSDPRSGFWTSRDGKSKLEFFVFESQSVDDLNRAKWEQAFLRDVNGDLVSKSNYSSSGVEVWVTSAKSKDLATGENELLQSAMVINGKVYVLRGDCTAMAEKDRQIVNRAILSLGRAIPQTETVDLDGPRGLKGTVWSAQANEWDSDSIDFSVFIPSLLARKSKVPEMVLANWYSYELGIQVRVARQPEPQPHEYRSASEFKEGFKKGFMSEMKSSEVEFGELRHQGREVWTADFEMNFFGVTVKAETWVFNVYNKIYVLTVCHDPDNPEAVNVAKAIFESIQFRELIAGSETGAVIDEPITFRPKEKDDADLAEKAGQFAGGCLVFLLIVWIIYKIKY